MKASSEKRLIVLVGCILALSCGEDGAAPGPAAILDIIDPSTTTDTIDAVTALTVEVRGGELPVRVRVDLGVRVGGRPHMIVPTHSIASQVLLWTDDTGRLTIPLAYGRDAGQVVVSASLAEDEGARDTVRFEILPGEPVLARAQPGDTLLAVGEEFDIAGTTVDRYGNVRDDDATSVSSDTSVVAVAGSGSHLRLSAAGEGIARVYLQVTTVLGTLADTTTVAVVPPETRLASGGLGFPLMASDPLGRDRRYADITLPNPAWDPQNPERVIGRSSRFASTTVRSYEFDIGRLTEVPVPAGLTAPSVPSFSPDCTTRHSAADSAFRSWSCPITVLSDALCFFDAGEQ